MKVKLLGLLVLIIVFSVSCFKEDQQVPPYVPPENTETISIENSLYDHQTYFDLGSGKVVRENENSAWVFSFECEPNGWHVRINSSDLWGVAASGSTNFDSTFTQNHNLKWWFDSSDGNPDSTAIGKWVSFESGLPEYSNEVYLIGKYDGITYEAEKKVQFIYVDENSYKFKVADPGENQADTVLVSKNIDCNYIQYSFIGNEVLTLEPLKNEWDILFTQYSTLLFTDDGVPTPYFVRGVLHNPSTVESALDTLSDFIEIDYSDASLSMFSQKQDAIGHDWKDVSVDEGSNTAEYSVRVGYTYIIKDTDSDLYKLRFKSYFDKSGVKGYPSFEYTRLVPD